MFSTMQAVAVLIILVLLIVNVSSSQYNPLKDPNICGRPNCPAGGKFNYQPGVKQQYQYSIDISTLFSGTSKNESTLHVDADVSLDFIGKCEGILSFTNIKLREKYDKPELPNSLKFKDAISEHPLRFSFHDGMIHEVCPHHLETNWVLNFKRGVLSLLHNTMKRFDLDHESIETDVHGNCPTSYTLEGSRNTSLIIEKVKDILACTNRYQHQSVLQTTHYDFRSDHTALPLVKSEYYCKLYIDQYVYNEVECRETHVFKPFSNQVGGATTSTKQRLILVAEEEESLEEEQPLVERRLTLLYNHIATPKPRSAELRVSRDLIKRLCKLSTDDMQIEFSDLFTKFIHTSRLLSHAALWQLYNRASLICLTGKKHMLDALPYLGSGAAVVLMKDLIIKNEVPDDVKREWLTAFAFIPRPDELMLSTVVEILEKRENDFTASLSIASMAHSYCKDRPHCQNNHQLWKIISILESRVTTAYKNKREDRIIKENMLVSLKAIANIGLASNDFKQLLLEIIEDAEEVSEIRVAAVETHRRFSCEKTHNYFIELLRNQTFETEVRIAAYLQVMRCPTYLTIRTVKHCLEMEEVNQVGSFIWSHLNNLLKSSMPSRVEIQGLLSNKDLGKKFSSDVRKFSHNHEGSVFFDEYNVGANYESNLIFSPSSYVPKSARLNLSIDLFGESVNLFEMNGRIEGFEHYLESIFGPKGPYNSRFIQNKISQIRFPRSASNFGDLKSEINNIPKILENSIDEPKMSLGFKIFGNDLRYYTFNGHTEINNALNSVNPVDYMKRILSGREISFNKAAMFLDTNYIVPTGAGFPINLNAVGTAAANLKLFGSLKGADFFKTKEFDLVGNISPSITIDVVGTMSVDAYYASTGIKLKSNVYTSTAVEGRIKVKGLHLVSVNFSLPHEKTEIFSVQSEMILMRGEKEEYQQGISKHPIQQSICSWPAVDKTIGLKLCAEYQFPNASQLEIPTFFLLAGPSKFRVSLQKADPTTKTYLLEYKWERTQSFSVISLVFDTPGSSIKRLLSTNLTLDVQGQNLTLFFETTDGTTLAKGNYKNTDDEKYLYLELDINDKNHFDARLSLHREHNKIGFTYFPKFFLGVHNERVAELHGQLNLTVKKDIVHWEVGLQFETKRLSTSLSGYISKSSASVTTKFILKYKFADGQDEHLHIEFRIGDHSGKNIQSVQSDFQLLCSAYPQFNFAASLKYQSALGHLDCKLDINSKPRLNDPNHTLTIQFVYMTTSTREGSKFNTFIEIKRPASQIDMKFQVRYELTGSASNVLVLIRYAKDKDIIVSLFLNTPGGNLMFLEGKLNVTLPSFTSMILEGKLHEKIDKEFDIELEVVWFSGHNVSILARYQDRSTQTRTSYHLKALIQSPSFHEISAACLYSRNETELKLEIKADHNNDEYSLHIGHSFPSSYEISSFGRVKYKAKVYSITSFISLEDYRQIMIGLHMDQFRDIHMAARVSNRPGRKELGVEIKWDANRDPDQKLMANLVFSNPQQYNYSGNFILSYPSRTINGIFEFAIDDYYYWTLGRLSWSPTELIDLKLSANYKFEAKTLITVKSELLTPFENWRRTSFYGGYHHIGNMYSANGSVYWQEDQYISSDFFGDYNVTDSDFICELSGSLVSAISEIPSMSTRFKHFQNRTKVDSTLRMAYNPDKLINVKSVWEILEDHLMKNLTGSISLISPFAGYNKGLLVSKIYFTHDMDIKGVADLDLDYKKYTANVEGHLQKLSESMFFFNVTTPIEKYRKLTGRFGFSEENRHLVAEIRAPSGAVGIEILFCIFNISDFNVKFNLATPIDFLQNALLVGKLKKDTADFRVGWNSLVVGFTGVWRYANITNFEYSYNFFTPIEGLEKNGVVAKLILEDGLDSEFSLHFSHSKAGIRVSGKPKPKLLKELGIKASSVDAALSEYDDYHEDEDDDISWAGLIEVDPIFFPTIKGTLDIDERGNLYTVLMTLTLPNGVAELRDDFEMKDLYTLHNTLFISTPLESYREITSKMNFKINGSIYNKTKDFYFNAGGDLNILNITSWVKTGFNFEYFHNNDDLVDVKTYNGNFHIHTPFEAIPHFDVRGVLEIEEKEYKVNFTLATNKTNISVFGSGETDDDFFDTSVQLSVLSQTLKLPSVKFHIKKDFSKVENRMDLFLDVENNSNRKYQVDLIWHVRSARNFNVHLKTELPIDPLNYFEGGLALIIDVPDIKVVSAQLTIPPVAFNISANMKENLVQADALFSNQEEKYNASFNGVLGKSSQQQQHSLTGILKYGQQSYDVNGNMNLYNDLAMAVDIEMVPESGEEKITTQYSIQPQQFGYVLRSQLRRGNMSATLEAQVAFRHKFDWNMLLQVQSTWEQYKIFMIDCKMITPNISQSIFIFEAKTPFRGIDYTKFGYELMAVDDNGNLHIYYDMPSSKGSIETSWQWVFMENMAIHFIGKHETGRRKKDILIDLFFVNLKKLRFGGELSIDRGAWATGANLTLSILHNNTKVEGHLKLPYPSSDIHSIYGKFHTSNKPKSTQYLAKYCTLNSQKLYSINGDFTSLSRTNFNGQLKVQWGVHSNQYIHNNLDLRRSENSKIQLTYKLKTPQFEEDTLISILTYGEHNLYHNVTAMLFYPESKQITDARINFDNLMNMNGDINVTTPFKDLPYVGSNFTIETQYPSSKRHILIFWPSNTAIIESEYTEKRHNEITEANGVLLLQVPLQTRHSIKVDYGYIKKPLHTTGLATIKYNKNIILDGKYKCHSESRAGLDKDTVNVELENKFSPIGLMYVHQFEYSASGDGSNLPTVDFKHLEVFQLHNNTGFNVTGEMHVRTTFTGQEIAIIALHSNRTVLLNMDYDVLDQRFLQKSRLQLAPNHWIAYDLDIINKTMDEYSNAQEATIQVSYPMRNFTILGAYNLSDGSLSSEFYLLWDKTVKLKTIQASLDWRQLSAKPNHQEIEFQIKHPSFEKNISFKGEYRADDVKIADIYVQVVYSRDSDKKFRLSGTLEDHSNLTVKNYTYAIEGSHPATSLVLLVKGETDLRHKWYYTRNSAEYQRTFLPLQYGEMTARLDLNKYEIEYQKNTSRDLSYFWGKYAGQFPLYTANISAIHGKDINASGEFYLNFREKLLQLELNMTEDSSQSFHMYGIIPDARSIYFNVWRDYEDIHVSDIAYFLRLNHSRLVVSSLIWRPEMKQNIKNAIKATSVDFYGNLTQNIDFWKQYIRTETADAITDIWRDAKPLIQGFLDDVKSLDVLEQDFEVLKTFVNESYTANEFYMQDIVRFTHQLVDELSLRSHIESLPEIVSEIWELMGESGEAIRKSISWILETIKNSYQKGAQFIHGLFHGEAMIQITTFVSHVFEKYDKFIKDLHVSFIKYMESLWDKTYIMIMRNWNKMLKAIEPTFIECTHYVETIVWQTSKEILDFIYLHTNEIVGSQYFNQFSNFTQDLDRFYKDITGNDIITVTYKYSSIVIHFLKEKYFAILPFGKELQDISSELLNELKGLKNSSSFEHIIEKLKEWYSKVKWLYDYFDIGNIMRNMINFLRLKISDITQTALEAENRYREAKTKFIFDPNEGIIHLEQKLPMSWHAFNETPKFEEIPEYKVINDVQNYFVASNTSFWNFYYDYKPYTEPIEWFPPFTAHAMLAGSQHYMTFDHKFFEFRGACTYLLAHDFMDGNFSVLVDYNSQKKEETYEIYLLLRHEMIQINVFQNTISIGNSTIAQLPVTLEDTFVYRQADIITVESASGFTLRCNMKFDVCVFDVSGWYFGKTAGLWGTINNEPVDDFLASTNRLVPHIGRFTQSWSFWSQSCQSVTNQAILIGKPDPDIVTFCESLFVNKLSSFHACFQRVSANKFYEMCLYSDSQAKACTTAVAYIEACNIDNTPLRVPDACVRCNLINGTEVEEGKFVQLKDEDVPKSTDIVFIVEAKDCNKDIMTKKNMDSLVSLLHKELTEYGITENRYAVVVFGGDGVFDQPRSVVINNNIFVDSQMIPVFFSNIPVGNGSVDIFNSIRFASNLVYRPGVSKTFILFPCTNCDVSKMRLDYSVLHQLLLENDITLHILMEEEFQFEKARMSKIVFGIDRTLAYTKKDGRELKGDSELRKQAYLPKTRLGYCTPLALETNGTVFTASKLLLDKRNAVKKFASVFAKRVAKTAVPNSCQTCECNAHDNGMSFMECYPCYYPTPVFAEDFDEDKILDMMQPMDIEDYDSFEE